jgi:hypothetical protein
VITIYISAFIIQDGYAQHDENTSEVTSQFKNAKISSDGIGVIIAAIAACIAAIGLFFNFFQMKKNQTNFKTQLKNSEDHFDIQIEENQKHFDIQIEENQKHFDIQIEENQKQFLEQMGATEDVNNAQLWLSFREFLTKYDEIAIYLRPGGDWSFENTGPSTEDEWAKVEFYMGVFEHANLMLDKKLIDLKTFQDIYKYRIGNILSNKKISEAKLRDKAEYWRNFIDLCRKLGLENKLPSLEGNRGS